METINYEELPLRYILCIDVKSFFASVEAVRRGINPLDAYLVVVSDLKRPGAVVLASSPKVKKEFNIKTGNRLFEIPGNKKIQLVEPSMGLYLDYNRKINRIFSDFAAPEDLLTYSIDESFLDVTSVINLFGNPWEIAEKIRDRIHKELGLVVTTGIGDNPLLSKLALDNSAKRKKSQIAYWSYRDIPYTVWKIPNLTDFWGIGRGYERQFEKIGISSIYRLAHFPKEVLYQKFGIMGLQHFYHANGVDYTRISKRVPAKNHGYGKGQVLMRDYRQEGEILIILMELVEEVAQRLRKNHKVCQEIHLQVGLSRHEEGKGLSKSKKITPTASTEQLKKYFRELFLLHWQGEAVRQLQIFCNRIQSSDIRQMDIFSMIQEDPQETVDKVLDELKDRFGKTAVFRGYNMLEESTFFERAEKVGGHKGQSEV